MLHSVCQQIWEIQQWPQDWQRPILIPVPKKGSMKECSNYQTTVLISHAIKVMLKILQVMLQQYMSWELPDIQSGFWQGRGTRDQIGNTHWTYRKQGNFRKISTSISLTMLKPLTRWITTNCGKFLERWEHQTTLPASCETWERGTTEDEMVEWHYQFNGHEIGHSPRYGKGQRGLSFCSPWAHRVGDNLATERPHPKCFLRNDNIHTRLQISEGAHRELKFWLKSRSKLQY